MLIGITERGDAGLDLSWLYKLDKLNGAILITKNLNDAFIDSVLLHRESIIVHATITGFGGTILESNVPTLDWSYRQLSKLVAQRFPIDQIVLRIDPIIPTVKGLKVVRSVLDKFKHSGINRVRFSFIDMYPHVKERFKQAGLRNPYEGVLNSFSPPSYMASEAKELFREYTHLYSFESCAEYITKEDNIEPMGCISQKDLNLLGIFEKPDFTRHKGQRHSCRCPGFKTELLSNKAPCAHGCLYCYWRNK